MLLGLKGNFESWIALLITTSQAANEDEVGRMGWIRFLSAYDGALGGDGRWRGKGGFQSLLGALGFHSGWIPRFSWNCGVGSQTVTWFC